MLTRHLQEKSHRTFDNSKTILQRSEILRSTAMRRKVMHLIHQASLLIHQASPLTPVILLLTPVLSPQAKMECVPIPWAMVQEASTGLNMTNSSLKKVNISRHSPTTDQREATSLHLHPIDQTQATGLEFQTIGRTKTSSPLFQPTGHSKTSRPQFNPTGHKTTTTSPNLEPKSHR